MPAVLPLGAGIPKQPPSVLGMHPREDTTIAPVAQQQQSGRLCVYLTWLPGVVVHQRSCAEAGFGSKFYHKHDPSNKHERERRGSCFVSITAFTNFSEVSVSSCCPAAKVPWSTLLPPPHPQLPLFKHRRQLRRRWRLQQPVCRHAQIRRRSGCNQSCCVACCASTLVFHVCRAAQGRSVSAIKS